MISFVWYSRFPFLAGAGGTEAFTIGIIRELIRRGYPVQVVTVGFGLKDGRETIPDIPFIAVNDPDDVPHIKGTLVFALDAPPSKTQYPAYFMLHCPVWMEEEQFPVYAAAAVHRPVITNSNFSVQQWAKHLGRNPAEIPRVYPFADDAFAKIKRPPHTDGTVRVLYASRLHQYKGIYTLLAALHFGPLADQATRFRFSVTTSGAHTPEGKIIETLVRAHPNLTVVPARKSPPDMAALMAEHDVVVMPSSQYHWHETFGMTSVEAQKAGCRVVASNDGGLPETDCGGLILVEPDNWEALARGILHAAELGPLTPRERAHAAKKFTVQKSTDNFLRAINYKISRPPR